MFIHIFQFSFSCYNFPFFPCHLSFHLPFVFSEEWETNKQKKQKKGHMEREAVKQCRLQPAASILYPVDSLRKQRTQSCKFGRIQSAKREPVGGWMYIVTRHKRRQGFVDLLLYSSHYLFVS